MKIEIGFFGILTITLIVLKALGYLHVSWWIVLLPVLIYLLFKLIIFMMVLIILKLAGNLVTKVATEVNKTLDKPKYY